MKRYSKGARSERELINFFSEQGFSVIRAAGSGVSATSPPDILVFKREKQYALECKAWNKNRIAIEHDKFEALKEWESNTGITTMIAWKISFKGWRFVYLDEMEENPKSYSITMKKILEIDRKIEELI